MIRVVAIAQRIGQESERFTAPGCTAVENVLFRRAKKFFLWSRIWLKDNRATINQIANCVRQVCKISLDRDWETLSLE